MLPWSRDELVRVAPAPSTAAIAADAPASSKEEDRGELDHGTACFSFRGEGGLTLPTKAGMRVERSSDDGWLMGEIEIGDSSEGRGRSTLRKVNDELCNSPFHRRAEFVRKACPSDPASTLLGIFNRRESSSARLDERNHRHRMSLAFSRASTSRTFVSRTVSGLLPGFASLGVFAC
jgi:hypothetical protein